MMTLSNTNILIIVSFLISGYRICSSVRQSFHFLVYILFLFLSLVLQKNNFFYAIFILLLIRSSNILEIFQDSLYKIMIISSNKDDLFFLFYFKAFYSFSYLITLAKSSNTWLKNNEVSQQICLVPVPLFLREMFIIEYLISYAFVLLVLRYVPSVLSLLSIYERMMYFVKCSFCIC